MGSFTGFVALTWMVATVLLCSQAAPVTEFFGPPQTIEGDSSVDVEYDERPKVEEMERFHRTYKNGTVEFKMALSNGHVQYQRIHTKIVDGAKVPVYEGYISEQYKDGRYGTRYYAADENGYRSSSVIVENGPPKLPTSGPYSSSLPRNIQDELAPLNVDDIRTKTKTILDNLIEIENDLEEDQLSKLHLESKIANENTVSTTESEILKQLENEEILEKKYSEDPSVSQNFNGVLTELPIDLAESTSTELPSISENHSLKVSEESESSTLPTLGEDSSSYGVVVEFNTEQLITKPTTESGKLEKTSDLPVVDAIRIIEEELAGRSLNNLNKSEILSEDFEDVKLEDEASIDIVPNLEHQKTEQPIIDVISEATTETILNVELTAAEKATVFDNEPSTGVAEIEEVKIDDETSRVSTYPLDDADSKSTTLSPAEDILNNSDETTKVLPEQPSLEDIPTESTASENESSFAPDRDNKSTDVNELPTEKSDSSEVENEEPIVPIEDIIPISEKSFEEVSETTTEILLNDEVKSNEHMPTFNDEDLEKGTGVPELTDTKISSASGYPLEDAELDSTALSRRDNVLKTSDEEDVTKIFTEQSSLEKTEDRATEKIAFENESNSDLPTSSLSSEIENKSTDINELPTVKLDSGETGVNKDLPLENIVSNNGDNSGVITNEKDARSFDFSKVLPLSENNSTSVIEESAVEEETNISGTLKPSEINEQTTNKVEISTEEPESIKEVSTVTVSSGDSISDPTTETDSISTTQRNNLEASSSDSSDDNITEKEISTDLISALTNSEENSSEANTEKSAEDETSTELPKEEEQGTQKIDLASSSADESKDNITEKASLIPTNQTSDLTSSEENSSEEHKDKLTEDEASTGNSEESSEDKVNTATIIENSTEAEILSATKETDTNTSGVEVEFYPPVIHF